MSPKSAAHIMDACSKFALFEPAAGWPDTVSEYGFVNLLAGTDDPSRPEHQKWAQMVWNESNPKSKWADEEWQRNTMLTKWQINRPSAVKWLKTLGETPETLHPYVMAWLGSSWRSEEQAT